LEFIEVCRVRRLQSWREREGVPVTHLKGRSKRTVSHSSAKRASSVLLERNCVTYKNVRVILTSRSNNKVVLQILMWLLEAAAVVQC